MKRSFGLIFVFLVQLAGYPSVAQVAYPSKTETTAYFRDWKVIGPFQIPLIEKAPNHYVQKAFFEQDHVCWPLNRADSLIPVVFEEKNYQWSAYKCIDGHLQFDSAYGRVDYAAIYAYTEFAENGQKVAFLDIDSDDAIRIWLNGEEVQNVVSRSLTWNQEVVKLSLDSGINQLLVKIQDIRGQWGLSIRMLDRTDITTKLVESAYNGDLDKVQRFLLGDSLIINAADSRGINALMAAQLAGRKKLVRYLIDRGANCIMPKDGKHFIDHYFLTNSSKKAPGTLMLITQAGKVIYSNMVGYAQIPKAKGVDLQTKFKVGSITKQFTACAILKLQQDGLLSIDDKLATLLPDFPLGDQVTLRQLLTHTAGIHNYTSKPGFSNLTHRYVSPEEVIAFFKDDPYDFDPGENFLYSNTGYFLLGYIVEKVSGKTLGQFLKKSFFKPLRMRNTGIYSRQKKYNHEAIGYVKDPQGTYTQEMDWNMSWAGGAGGLYSTAEDLVIWNESLFSGKVLPLHLLNEAWKPGTLENGHELEPPYGLGWMINNYRGIKIIEHTGHLPGFTSLLARIPQEKMTICVLNNSSPPACEFNSQQLAEFYLWPRMTEQPLISTKGIGE